MSFWNKQEKFEKPQPSLLMAPPMRKSAEYIALNNLVDAAENSSRQSLEAELMCLKGISAYLQQIIESKSQKVIIRGEDIVKSISRPRAECEKPEIRI